MTEEETSFTFIDKRRTQTESPSIVQEPSPSVVVPEIQEAHDELDSGQSPTTYDLIGYCLNLLASQAWQKLGLLADPQTGECHPDLPDAKLAIDVVGDLAARFESAPEALVPADLRRDLRTLLNDLRLNYVARRGENTIS